MQHKAEYRSSVRSKKMIRDAFTELLQTTAADKITVTDIAQKAGLNRGTFYAHYEDINALVQSIEDDITDNLYRLFDDGSYPRLLKDPLPMFLKISDYLEENKELITALMGSHMTNPFIEHLPGLIARHLASSDDIDEKVRGSASFQERCYFYAGGAGSLYMAWFRGMVGGCLRDVAYRLAEIVKHGY